MATPVVTENDGNLESHIEKETVVKPKRIVVKEVPPAHKKIGHLKVHKDGEMLYKKTPSSTLMQSLQLGIQQVVGSLEPKPKRDLLMTDFEVVEVTDFPSGGSEFTPAHRHKDFRFKDYSPVAFRFFREAFQIKPEDYMVSLCHNPMTELSNPGASGSLFYRSADDEFIMKTVSRKEAEFLQKLLPGYYLNLTQNKRTLLPKFFGLYNYQSGGKNIRITVMNNLLPSTIEYHEKYDLKGSTYKRYASHEESIKAHPTFKDVDFSSHHPEGIILAADVYDQLMSTVKRDVMVLKSFGIMDYSLLMGIHNIDEELRKQQRDKASSASPTVDGAATLPPTTRHQPSTTTESPLQRSLTVRRLFSIIPESATTQTPNLSSIEDATSMPYEVPPGGVMGKTEKGERVLIFLGIIDILQSYRLRKKLEHTLKSVIIDGDTVSVHKPGFYMKRFYEHISNKVFKKEVKEKTRPKTRRSISGRPPGMRRQASLGSEDAANIKPHLARQSISSPEQDDAAKNQRSSPLLNDPPPVYTEKPHKSPEHLLVPRLSSVEEFHEPSLSPTANSDEMTTHEIDHTPTTMVTSEEAIINSEVTSQPVTFTVTSARETSEHVTTTNSSKVDATMTTNELSSEETKERIAMVTNSEETDGHVTMTTSSGATNAPITVTISSSIDDTITMTTNSEVDNTMTTNQAQESKSTSDTIATDAMPTNNGDVEVVDPSEINIVVTGNDSV